MNDDNKIRTGLWKKEGFNGVPSKYSGKVEITAPGTYWVDLYKNDRKETDKHPDLNLQFKPAGEAPPARHAPQPAPADFADDEIIHF